MNSRRAKTLIVALFLSVAPSNGSAQNVTTYECESGANDTVVAACGARWEAANIRAHVAAGQYGGATPECLNQTAAVLDGLAAKWLAKNTFTQYKGPWPCGREPSVGKANDDVLSSACPGVVWTYKNKGATQCSPSANAEAQRAPVVNAPPNPSPPVAYAPPPPVSSPGSILETGSSLLYPLINLWAPPYAQSNPQVKITTQATGSGTGISQAVNGAAQLGASDAYMSDVQMAQTRMLNIPLAISAQTIVYNIPGLNTVHLNFSGSVLAGIYDGSIQFWDDPRITSLNSQYAGSLPHASIIPVRRSDGSGDTFVFTQYLSATTPSWRSGPGFGTTISWPSASNSIAATGNAGMVQACQGARYGIAYISIGFISQTVGAGLGYSALQNAAGKFVLPNATNISAAASERVSATPSDERISLVYSPGDYSYPIVNYEYAIIRPRQNDAATAAALKSFLTWALTTGQNSSYLNLVHFAPLPPSIVNLSMAQVSQIGW
jgi:phosphate transport system substrate-binding protein